MKLPQLFSGASKCALCILIAGAALAAGPAWAGVTPGGPMVGGPGAGFTIGGPVPSPPAPIFPPPVVVPPPTGPTPGGPTPVAPPPDIPVVQLGPTFAPTALQLSVGQQFVVLVSQGVQATWAAVPDSCPAGQSAQVAGGVLALQCTASGGYMFTAEQPGSVTLLATVRPSCAPGTACPQWLTEATLQITVT
jgi:hypothetical protein